MRVEQAVVGEVLDALQLLGIHTALKACAQRERQMDATRRQRELGLEQARFEAGRARRQYDAVEPENRLVTAELELRWNEALQVVAQRKAALEALNPSETLPITEPDLEVERIIRALARLMPDARIAGLLNRLGKRTAKGHSWTRNRVCCFRNDHQIPVYEEGERQSRNELTLEEAANRLGVSTMTVRRLIKRKLLPATQICVGAPWVIQESALSLPTVASALRDTPPTANDKQGSVNFQ